MGNSRTRMRLSSTTTIAPLVSGSPAFSSATRNRSMTWATRVLRSLIRTTLAMRPPGLRHDFAEVQVERNDNAVFCNRHCEDLAVGQARETSVA
jgi:hypothetical protein